MPNIVPGEGTRSADPRFDSSRHRAIVELAALDNSDFDAVLRRILQTDAIELEVDRVNCWRLEADSAIRCVAGYLRESGRFGSGAVIEAATCPGYFQALADDPIILADDARADSRTREFTDGYLVPLGITSMMDVPIWVRGRLWGVVCHEHVGPARQWTSAERDFAITIGHIVSMAVEARERLEAERTARFSEFFVGVLSHDLRTPLGSIRAAADVLLLQHKDETMLRATQRIVRNTDRMTSMIEQLLDFTRIRIGDGLSTKRASVDVAELCGHAVSELQSELAAVIDVHAEGDTVGLFDADRLWQALSNLLANAFEHGAAGGRIRIRIDGTDPDSVEITVTNAGTISPTLMPVIFDPFRRHQVERRERMDGLGLGLYIVREIVAAHGGSITVHADAGEVAFRVLLPRD